MKVFKTVSVLTMLFILQLSTAAWSKDITRSDTWLDARLTTAYALNQHLNPFNINVDVENGVAVISGQVDNSIEKSLAVEIARSIEGIKDVVDQLNITPDAQQENQENHFSRKINEISLAAKVKLNLLWHKDTSGLDINVNADNNNITLSGNVDSSAEKDLAGELVRNTTGVGEVKNMIRVQPGEKPSAAGKQVDKLELAVTDTFITTKVKSRLLYDKHTDGLLISVSTRNGIVTLEGNVPSKAEKTYTVNMVQKMPRVKKVNDRLKVLGES